MRCFLAVPLEEPALAEAQRLLASLREEVPAVRWVRPEALHVTVHFFGCIDDEQVRAGLKAVMPVVDIMPPFGLALDRLGGFPERGRTRVLWLGTSRGASLLNALASGCREALGRAGFDVDARPFRPHCTLGRPRNPWPHEGRQAWRAATEQPLVVPAFAAARLVLYESISATGGNHYVEHASFPFSTANAEAGADA